MRRPYVVGNWKMNSLLADARKLVLAIRDGLTHSSGVDVGVAPPAVWLLPACQEALDSPVEVGAQNVFHEPKGAYTGELSPAMLMGAGCRFAIVGHSERRQIFGETGPMLQKKVNAVLDAGLTVIFCIGETLEQRERDETHTVLTRQLTDVMVDGLEWQKVTIAYEPVWAIGTGKVATPDQAQDAHRFVRDWLKEMYGPEAASSMRIQYGGSVKPANASELMSLPDVDGALVGGASLKADDFLAIVRAAKC